MGVNTCKRIKSIEPIIIYDKAEQYTFKVTIIKSKNRFGYYKRYNYICINNHPHKNEPEEENKKIMN